MCAREDWVSIALDDYYDVYWSSVCTLLVDKPRGIKCVVLKSMKVQVYIVNHPYAFPYPIARVYI